jgi:hypothetical protein
MVPRCVYFTDGKVQLRENQKGRFLTSIRSEICYHCSDLARVSDDHAQIPGQIDLKVEAFALCLVLVQVRSLPDHRWEVERFVERPLVAAFDPCQILKERVRIL